MKPKLLIVLGPTAVGKSDTVLHLAGQIDAEIINADSQQVYRHMDVGTAKPSREQRDKVLHHLIDVVEPDQEFNVADYRRLAIASASRIAEGGKQAIVCGGTGLYIKALTMGLFVGPRRDAGVRACLDAEAENYGIGSLYRRLERMDPSATSWIHPHDRQRIIRALEVYQLTGKPISEWQKEHAFKENPFHTLKIGLDRDRAELYELINQRCDRMIQAGLVEEVKGLVEKGYGLDLKPLQSVGYKHIGLFLKGQMNLEQTVFLMKRDTRRLAKRQLTWFRCDNQIRWFHPEKQRQEVVEAARSFLA